MPELARNIATRLRKFLGNRRRAERIKAQLNFVLSLTEDRAVTNSRRPHSLEGHTLDLSVSGLALMVPAIRLGDHYLAGEGRGLDIELELPSGTVAIQANAVRYERLDEDESAKGYLIGVTITAMSDSDRDRYDEYVSSFLSK